MSPPQPRLSAPPPPQPAGSSFVTAGGEEPAVTSPFSNVFGEPAPLGATGMASYLLYHVLYFGFCLLHQKVHPQGPRIQPVQNLPAKEKLSGKRTRLFTFQSVCPPPVSFPVLLTNFPRGLANKETAQNALEACEGRTRAHLFEVDSGALSTTPHPFSSLW